MNEALRLIKRDERCREVEVLALRQDFPPLRRERLRSLHYGYYNWINRVALASVSAYSDRR